MRVKLIDKIKNAIFEEDEFEETELVEEKEQEQVKEKPKRKQKQEEVVNPSNDEIVKKIDIEKTIPKKIDIIEEPEEEVKPVFPKREHRVTPMIFDENDFIMEEEPITPPKKKEVKKEEPKKTLYAGYKDEKQKEKFKPSPVLSPVYGFVGVSPVLEHPRNEKLSSFNEMFAEEKKETVTLDEVRKKAYGEDISVSNQDEEDDDLGLLYDMKQDKEPAISKITLGDAEEYFEDLGLEYNVDYKDSAKAQTSRVKKNEHLEEEPKDQKVGDFVDDLVEESVEEEKLEITAELEITKEQLKPRTAKEIKKVKKIKDLDVPEDQEDAEEPDEKNLYDLIDMMYESNE